MMGAQMSVAEREEIKDASKAKREGDKDRTLLISQDCESEIASKEAHKVIHM